MKEVIDSSNPNNAPVIRRTALAVMTFVALGGCAEVEDGPVGRDGASVSESTEGTAFPEHSYSYVTTEGETKTIDCLGQQQYEVEEGDTLIGIAQENVDLIYSDPLMPLPHEEAIANFIADINEIEDENLIQIGQDINLPTNCDISIE